MVDQLWVFLSDQRVGLLEEHASELRFKYEPAVQTPLSVNLPIREQAYEDGACRPFFDNLLPEGGWRQAICRQLRIDVNNDFQLLAAIGTECAGAVSLHADPQWTQERGTYISTSEADLRRWALNPASRPSLQASPGLRLSLAGAQDKLLFHLDGTHAYLCEGGAPSTVILKPDIKDTLNAVELSAFNELLSVCLARKCGLNAVEAFWYAAGYAVRRYDRLLVEGTWKRLHQEDFAQIAAVPASAKYEEHGGPSWGDCFRIIDSKTPAPAAQRLELLNRLFFSFCLGNNDAHAKNFALLHAREGGPRLAPAYDLLCTQIYGTLPATMAMSIGGQADPAKLDSNSWSNFARDTGFALPALRRFATDMSNRTKEALPDLLSEVEAAHPALKADVYPITRRRKFCKRFAAIVETNCERLVKSLASAT
jgi:serine/threonine-protein kinase HipA